MRRAAFAYGSKHREEQVNAESQSQNRNDQIRYGIPQQLDGVVAGDGKHQRTFTRTGGEGQQDLRRCDAMMGMS